MNNAMLIIAAISLILFANIAAATKRGECPPIDEDHILCVDQINPCAVDEDCDGIDKCCYTGCSPLCMKPDGAAKPGYCPVVALDAVGTCVEECASDYDCSGTEKCCGNGCGNTCQRARTSKPGECPAIGEEIICYSQINPCDTDMDCEGVEKCCWTGCSPYCAKPAPREGVCPTGGDGQASCDLPSCEGDYDCVSPQKCCPASACGTNKCLAVEVPKPGLCPAVEEGMMGICMEGCTADSDCGGLDKCCSNGCGHACKPPSNNTCTVLGKEYLPGLVPDPDGCNSCSCMSNGGLACTRMMCTCDFSEDKTYSMGESYPKGDGCNECKCRGNRDNLGQQCTDYYCGPEERRGRKGKGCMKTFAIVSVVVGVLGIIVTITVLVILYNKQKKRSNAKKTAKVDDTNSKAQLVDEAGPLPIKA